MRDVIIGIKRIFIELIGLMGASILCFGFYQLSPPAGYIVGGLELIVFAYLMGKKAQ